MPQRSEKLVTDSTGLYNYKIKKAKPIDGLNLKKKKS